jgi:drug/metabolite transporter (DMT)-like permease
LTILVIKVLARTDSSVTITVYMGATMAPLALIAAAPVWQWPALNQLPWLALIALLGTLGQVSLAQAFRMAEVSAVLPLDFLKLVWGTLLGLFLFAEVPDALTWLGGVMIFAATTWLALRESRPPIAASGARAAPRAAPAP